jgi:peroxiredoxin
LAAASPDFEAHNTRLLIVGPGSRQHAQRFRDLINAGNTPVLYDDSMRVYDAYMLNAVFFSLIQKSAAFLVDQEGTVRYAYQATIASAWKEERLSELLATLDSL